MHKPLRSDHAAQPAPDDLAVQLQAALTALALEREAHAATTAQLAARTELQQRLLDAIPASFWFKDNALRYQVVNAAFCRFHNVERAAIIGRTSDEILPAPIALGIRVSDAQAFQSGEPYRSETRLEIKPGTAVWIETIKQVIYDAAGNRLGLVGIAHDVTERRNAKEALRASEQRYRRLLQSLPDTTTLLIDHELRWIIGDGAHLDRLCTATPVPAGTPIADALHPNIIASIVDLTRAALDGRIASEQLTVDGRIFHCQATPLTLDGAGAPGALLVLQDITGRIHSEQARLQIERTLQEAQRQESLGLLAGGIAHDFNNLLTGILGHAELIQLDTPPDDPRYASLQQIIAGAQYAAKLAGQLLAYAGRGRYLIQPLNLNTLVTAMTELICVSLPKSATVEYALNPELPPIAGDVAQIQQVVLNLLTNAADALSGSSGVVRLSTDLVRLSAEQINTLQPNSFLEPGAYVLLEVADNGCGMDAHTLAHLFDPFFTTKQTGRGLGLAAVRGIVQGHRGLLAVDSAPGQGTTFRIWLPAVAAPQAEITPPGPQDHTGGTIMIVDDEAPVRAVLAAMLQRLGHTVYEAADGEVGARQVLDYGEMLTAVMIDLTMPGVSGDVVARMIRNRFPHMPIILMSGYHADEITREHRDLCSLTFLHKPFTLDTLRTALAQALHRRSTSG
jgi:PAS domain S-box-containing protein